MAKVFGIVERKCPKCGHKIPENTRECPAEGCNHQWKFNQSQYNRLVACAYEPNDILRKSVDDDFKDEYPPNRVKEMSIRDWNDWRTKDKPSKILLQAADLEAATLAVPNANDINPTRANFEKANLAGANLKSARLNYCFLWGADLTGADARGAVLYKANLDRADLRDADFRGAFLDEGTYLSKSVWEKDKSEEDEPQEEEEREPENENEGPEEDGKIKLNTKTDFRGAALTTATVEPELLGQLQYNCRRLNWEDWYDKQSLRVEGGTRLFWWLSDYGRSTRRLIIIFFVTSFLFAVVYTLLPDLIAAAPGGTEVWKVSGFSKLVRSLYFSIVTMTTLGLGDLYANADLQCAAPTGYFYGSQIVLCIHVLAGYVIMGALITRFAIMFQGGIGPVEKPEVGWNATWTERPRVCCSMNPELYATLNAEYW